MTTTQAQRQDWTAAWIAFVVALFAWGAGFYGLPMFVHTLLGWWATARGLTVCSLGRLGSGRSPPVTFDPVRSLAPRRSGQRDRSLQGPSTGLRHWITSRDTSACAVASLKAL